MPRSRGIRINRTFSVPCGHGAPDLASVAQALARELGRRRAEQVICSGSGVSFEAPGFLLPLMLRWPFEVAAVDKGELCLIADPQAVRVHCTLTYGAPYILFFTLVFAFLAVIAGVQSGWSFGILSAVFFFGVTIFSAFLSFQFLRAFVERVMSRQFAIGGLGRLTRA